MSTAEDMAAALANRRPDLAAELRAIHAQNGPEASAWQRRANANFARLVSEGVVVEQDGITGVETNTKPRLALRPYPLKHAEVFCRQAHRRQPVITHRMWAIACTEYGVVRGVAIVGSPVARMLDNGRRLEVRRVAVEEGVPHACSMLYGACSRAARAMGCTDLLTYTHLDEPGTSLRAAGWIEHGQTDGGEHSRPSRPRAPVVDALPKRRWLAPWSSLLKETR